MPRRSTKKNEPLANIEPIGRVIRVIRGQRVILDSDLAKIYGVTTKRLNEQVKRNRQRFPEDFMFRLTGDEGESLQSSRSQIATGSESNLWSQVATSRTHGGRRYLPYAFTEHRAVMTANVLNSERAVAMSVYVVRVCQIARGVGEQRRNGAEAG